MTNDGRMKATATSVAPRTPRRPSRGRSRAARRAARARAARAPAPRRSPRARSSRAARRGRAACSRRARSDRRSRTCRAGGSTGEIAQRVGSPGRRLARARGAAVDELLPRSLRRKYLVEGVEHGRAAREARFVVGRAARRCRRSGARRRGSLDGRTSRPSGRCRGRSLRSRASAGSSRPKAREQHLEGAAVAVVRVLGLEHVEAQLAALRAVAAGGHELEGRAVVDEAPDEPGAGDAIDVDALARDPASASGRRRWTASASHGSGLGRSRSARSRCVQAGDESFDGSRPGAPKKSIRTISSRRLRKRASAAPLPSAPRRRASACGTAPSRGRTFAPRRQASGSPLRARGRNTPRTSSSVRPSTSRASQRDASPRSLWISRSTHSKSSRASSVFGRR